MFGCENRTTVPIEVTLNLSKTNDIEVSAESKVVKRVIEPNQVEFLAYVRRQKDGGKGIDYDIDFKHKEL